MEQYYIKVIMERFIGDYGVIQGVGRTSYLTTMQNLYPVGTEIRKLIDEYIAWDTALRI